jgi:hypothetical protein
MRTIRLVIAATVIVLMSVWTAADQAPGLSRVMRQKLARSQAILGAVITSDWNSLERESRALVLVTRDPAWVTSLTDPEYLRQSDAFAQALQRLIEASGHRDSEAAGRSYIALTTSCLQCHSFVARRRIAR